MKEELNNRNSVHSTDNIKKRQKRFYLVPNKSNTNYMNNQEEIDNLKTISNISRILNTHNDNNSNTEDFLDYKNKYNTINTDENMPNNDIKNSQKKKVETKVNTNIKLLKIIKERMKEQKYKNIIEKDNKNKTINIEENLNNNITKDKEEEKEKGKEKDLINKNKDKDQSKKEDEKKSILLKIINAKKYNKYQRNENKKDLSGLPNNNENDEKEKNISNRLFNSSLNDNQKESVEESKNDKDLINNRLNNNIGKNNTRNNIKSKLISLNNKEKINKSFSKKDSMKILELLKSKKKEESINKIKKEDESRNKKGEIKNNVNSINSYGYRPKRNLLEKSKNNEIMNLPKKNFRDEEDDDDDYLNKTQQYPIYKSINQSNNDTNNRVTNYFNLDNKKLNNKVNNNNISNNNKSFQNYTKISKIKYNPISIYNNYRERQNNIYDGNNKNDNNTSTRFTNYNSTSYLNNNNLKTFDNNNDMDINKDNKKPVIKKLFNKSLINSRIYKPKRIISNNNSPQRHKLNQNERNTIDNTESFLNDINKNLPNYTKIQKPSKSYIKNPEKHDKQRNVSLNNNTIDDENHIYNKKPKKLISSYKNKDYFNTSYNIIGYHPKNKRLHINDPISSLNATNDDIRNSTSNYNTNINLNLNNSNMNNNMKRTISMYKQNKNSMMFNLEDLMILEERLNDISIALETNENIDNNCFNFWNYFFNCSLYNLLEKIFKNKEDSNIVRLSIKYKLMSIMVCYEYAIEIEPKEEIIFTYLSELIDLNHDNLIIICEYILTKIMPENKQNIWVLKLQEIINLSKLPKKNKSEQENYGETPIEKISNNIDLIIKSLNNILGFPTTNSEILINFMETIDNKSYEEINDFFRDVILRVDNFEGSIIASSYLKKNKNFETLPAPYLVSPPKKPNTLVLDLDETLVYFKMKSSKGGTLKARPYLFGFLEEMRHYYELVIWTSATETYANSLIDAIEYEKKYFDYILYREHATIIGGDFVKDLTRIGRGLDRVIIIDDMPQNFRLQKENGITIKPFFGDDYDDSALYELVPILKHIAEDRQDVRIGLKRYKEEIVKKVTSNISKQNIY